jgi:two-component system, chemotaxis family, chemotaxis protein CheY
MTTAFAPKSKLMIVTACTTTAHHRNIVGDRMKAIFGTSVLIVEGQRAIFQLIQELLIDLGLRDIQHASDGMSALRKLGERPRGLVLSDLGVEPMNGLELLKSMRSAEHLKTIPFVLLTGDAQPEKVAEAKRLGVDGYILKPFSATTLRSTLAKALIRPQRRSATAPRHKT